MLRLKNPVLDVAPADSDEALAHFQDRHRFETDCWDVHQAMGLDDPGFVLLDVRSRDLYVQGHVPGAVHFPHATINARRMLAWPPDTVFVVYCAGPHCNAASRAAARLARLGRPVKEMLGGVEGWRDEGFSLCTDGVACVPICTANHSALAAAALGRSEAG